MIEQWLRSRQPSAKKGDGTPLYTCPVCHGRNKLEVHKTKPVWYCHKCGRGGALAVHPLTLRAKFPPRTVEPSDYLESFHAIDPYDTHRFTTWLFHERDLYEDERCELRPHVGPDPFRVYFPCYDLGSGIPVLFVGRLVTEGEPKYLYPPLGLGKRPSEVLWGVHRLCPPVKCLRIVEGVFDAVHYPNTVALLGSTISQAQCEIVRAIAPKEITVMLDEFAEDKAAKVVESLSKHVSVPIYRVDWGKVRRWIKRRKQDELDPDRVRQQRLLDERRRVI